MSSLTKPPDHSTFRARASAGFVGVVSALSLVACGSSGTPVAAPTPASVDPAAAGKAVPQAFDNTKGWMAKDAEGTPLTDPALASHAGLVLFASVSSDEQTARVLGKDERTGATRWTSDPVSLPKSRDTGTSAGPRLYTTSENGKDYAIFAATGEVGGDEVNKAEEVTRLEIFDLSTGATTAREVTIPAEAGTFTVQDGGSVLVEIDRATAVVDAATGKNTTYQHTDPALNAPKPCTHDIGDCNLNLEIPGMTAKGPLVEGYEAFWVPGGWFSDDAIPHGASADIGGSVVHTYGSPDGRTVVADWPSEGDPGDIWSVHDAATGQVIASVPCALTGLDDSSTGKTKPPAVSADGRYLLAGLTVFDLRAKKGYCFAETDTRKQIDLVSVDPDGTVYGTTDSDTPVSVALPSGDATPLPEDTLVPTTIDDKVAVVDDSSDGVYVYPRR
ncbi:hypothetical protein FPZ12_013945 [Amycolatopsis acidicola]|uniref:PQQ-binding-like beta-propeller repeat protein n=1 Tax=Amycolatopsis acidicola TaxID=2596893 RepID=A0A5N0V5F7_9PSEU|nr:hypothetical protein [Amycolatopsis acidicola]KAA9161606.1 hypothetical protein FPZ12_013945 [Amycolatopsis acidicola]